MHDLRLHSRLLLDIRLRVNRENVLRRFGFDAHACQGLRLRAAIIVAVHARAVGIVLMALIAVAIVLARARPRVGVRELLLQLADAVLLRV